MVPLEPFADIAMRAVPPAPVPLAEPFGLDEAFGLAALPMTLPPDPGLALPPPPPPPRPRRVGKRSPECRRLVERYALEPMAPADRDALRVACGRPW